MKVEIAEAAFPAALAEYSPISIAFEVSRVYDVSGAPWNAVRFLLTERSLAIPYEKDYDSVAGDPPRDWARRFDLSRWITLFAREEGRAIGAAAIAFDTPGVEMLEGRRDLAVLWDIRVAPESRGRGVGLALFRATEAWARSRGCVELKVETQNINVPACLFYVGQGCQLRAVNRGAYPDLPHEIQLLWHKDLSREEDAPRP